ncbi:MAG TPA: Ig-like domain repeat protein [Tepidisphaeraceae bacterium]|jgi:hypothetical protein|nr:Ig-like domain repeat protein [Tepidisphaeraceae bacterium]
MFQKLNERRRRHAVLCNATAGMVEPLESRLLMTTVVVNTAIDTLYPAGSGLVSIRNAVETADSGTTPTTITFDPTMFATAQSIILNGTQLELSNTTEPTIIIGPAAGLTLDGNANSRIFKIDSNVSAEISDLTITNGQSQGYDYGGGGINNAGTLVLTGATLSGNHGAVGGGLNNSGTATLADDTFTGGVSNNDGLGGTGYAAGVASNGTMTVEDCTIVDNTANSGAAGLSCIGGTCTVVNSIIADNLNNGTDTGDASGTFTSYGYNLVGATDGSSGWNVADKTGTAASLLSPDLGALANNGGPTDTFLPNAGSPVIGAGTTLFVPAALVYDQRGLDRETSGAVDIGAVEQASTAAAPTLTTATVNSTSDAAATSGTMTLRGAIALANSPFVSPSFTINFDPTAFAAAQTITIATGNDPFTFSSPFASITLTGPDAGLTITTANTTVGADGLLVYVMAEANVGLSAVTFTGGQQVTTNSSGYGGAFDVDPYGTMSLTDSTITDCNADYGGALLNNGYVTLINDTFFGNSSGDGDGGAIYTRREGTPATLAIENCTIVGNSAEGKGGGIADEPNGVGNTTVTIANSVVAGNTAGNSGPDIEGAVTTDEGYNLFGAVDGSSSGLLASDLTGSTDAPLAPDLGSLADNGGPTQTLVPQAGSPVIGAGEVSLIPSGVTTDQRGLPRTLNGAVDIGAVEVQSSGGQTGAAATTTTLGASSASIASGDSVTLRASVSSATGQPTGAVTFLDDGGVIGSAQLASGTAMLTTATLASGSNSITASYSGDSIFAASTSAAATITVGGAPAIYITDGAKGTIGEYTTSGAAVNASLVSGLARPANLSLLGNDLYVADLNSDSVGEYTTSGAAVNPSLISGVYPWSLAATSTDIYVVDNSLGTVSDYSLDGTAMNTQLVTGLFGPGAIVADGPDLFIENNVGANIRETTTAGATVEAPFLSGLNGASGMAISGTNLFVCNYGSNTVGEYTTSGATVNASLITGLDGPNSIAVYGGDLYVVSTTSGTIGQYTMSGATVNASFISGLASPLGIAIGGSISTTSTAASVTSVTASAQTIATGESEVFTATVAPAAGPGSAPTGAVTFLDNGAAIGSAQLVSGTAIFTTALPVGSNSITASYSGDSNYAPSASAALTQTILAASSATPTLPSISVPTSGLAGGKFIVKAPIVITNTGSTLSGEFAVVLYLDLADSGLDANPIQLDKLLKHAVLKSGKGFAAPLKTNALPTSVPSGTYHLVAEVTDPSGNVNFVTSAQTVTIAAAFVQPAATVGAVAPSSIVPGKSGSLIVTVANNGNVAASAVTISLSPSSDNSTPIAGAILDQIHSGARILPGKSKSFRLRFKVPSGTAAGTYYPYLSIALGGVTTTTLGAAFTVS